MKYIKKAATISGMILAATAGVVVGAPVILGILAGLSVAAAVGIPVGVVCGILTATRKERPEPTLVHTEARDMSVAAGPTCVIMTDLSDADTLQLLGLDYVGGKGSN